MPTIPSGRRAMTEEELLKGLEGLAPPEEQPEEDE
jgi:DNA-directed RNA polymerase subunit omega